MEMNTIGKILVILNFVFALVVGGFLVIDFATRTNWKTAYDTLKREMDVLKASREANQETLKGVVNSSKAVYTENEAIKQKLKDAEDLAAVNEANLKRDVEDYKLKLKGKDQLLDKAGADVERLKTELVDRDNTIKLREKEVVEALADRNKYRAEAIAQEGRSKALQDRNEQLLEEVQKKTLELARVQAGSGGAGQTSGTLTVRNINEPNPPPVKVKGRIEKVDSADKTLVQISLGSDQGINRNNTLDVYRLRPEAKYLGMIRIVDVYPDRSVGRLAAPPGGGARMPLQEGDMVTSDLRN
jgi:chromosome segregation ATPase